MSKLKHCPFCGSGAETISVVGMAGYRAYKAYCVSCPAELRVEGPDEEAELEAIKRWNARVVEEKI